MWSFQYFMKQTAKAVISAINTNVDKKRHKKDGQLTSYDMVANYLLRTYESNYIIANIYLEINQSKQTTVCILRSKIKTFEPRR